MSSLIVEVCAIEEIAVHPNADRLEKIRVKNWWCIASKNYYKVGDKVVYLPPDSIISEDFAAKWGIAKYCVPTTRNNLPAFRIRANRFRGEPSFGCVQNPDLDWDIGTDVKEYYNITKYEPPIKALDGDAASPVHAFHAYTDIENFGNFPRILQEGEEVVITEKLHGTNNRVGLVFHAEEENFSWQYMAGSHGVRRKEFNDKEVRSKYWFPLTDSMKILLNKIKDQENAQQSVIVFGEIFGNGIQDMKYGQGGMAYRVFDIAVDGKYLNWDKVLGYLSQEAIPPVPVLYRGFFCKKIVDELVDGPTTICAADEIKENFKGREGIVIKPTIERFDHSIGRVILKYISVDYHDRKNPDKTEDH